MIPDMLLFVAVPPFVLAGLVAMRARGGPPAMKRLGVIVLSAVLAASGLQIAAISLQNGYYTEPLIMLLPPFVLSLPLALSPMVRRHAVLGGAGVMLGYLIGVVISVALAFGLGYVEI